MKNIVGFLLLFFIHLFFLNLGINGTLSKREKEMVKYDMPLFEIVKKSAVPNTP